MKTFEKPCTNLTGLWVRRKRRQLGMSQAKLALEVGVTPHYVSRWEMGSKLPDPDCLVTLARLTDSDRDFPLTLLKEDKREKRRRTGR